LESTIERGGEHKEDSQEDFKDVYTENQSTSKIIIKRKKNFGKNKLEY
jgi:uncharacterized protein (UPF0335 family)